MKLLRPLFVLTLLFLIIAPRAHAQSGGYVRSPYLGITFISSAEQPANETRYRNALLLGAGWNRYPFYWNFVERQAGAFDWRALDRVVWDDMTHGLKTNAILMGIPEHARQGRLMRGLYAPIFSDGSDYPAAGKLPNPANPWARYVYEAVTRYKPNGTYANQTGWDASGAGISVWEVWNEPDFEMFWDGTAEDYARLLRVSYVIIKHVDPFATVMFGGLSFAQPNTHNWLRQVLNVIAQDPSRGSNNWYFDQLAFHSYSSAWRTVELVAAVRRELARFGLERPLWLNESGVPVWDDYPGPTWTANTPTSRRFFGTQAEQAVYVIQNTTLAWAAGVDVVFYHQLYDDCGNQASGTDFPPNNGELCAAGACWGDAHGLYRNERVSACFRQSPQAGMPRLAASAYYRLAQAFGSRPFIAHEPLRLDDAATVLVFEQVNNGIPQRIYVLWGDTSDRRTVLIPASGSAALLYGINNQQTITPLNGMYQVALAGAQTGGLVTLTTERALGGEPLIMVEAYNGAPADTGLIMLEGGTPREPVAVTPGAITVVEVSTATPVPTARPTTDPALDTTPPISFVETLPATSPTSFTVRWGAMENSGITQYLVWARVDGGEWQPWQQTGSTEAIYTGSSGSYVEFAVWALDLAGNWSPNVDLAPQAATTIQ